MIMFIAKKKLEVVEKKQSHVLCGATSSQLTYLIHFWYNVPIDVRSLIVVCCENVIYLSLNLNVWFVQVSIFVRWIYVQMR